MTKQLILTLPALVFLVACNETSMDAGATGKPTVAEQACLRDVAAITNNPEVALLGSEFSEAGTLVRVGVGPDRAPWQCTAYSNGTTDGIQFLGDEGFL